MGKLQKDEEIKISQMKKKKKEGKTNGDQISMNKLSMVPDELCCHGCARRVPRKTRGSVFFKNTVQTE